MLFFEHMCSLRGGAELIGAIVVSFSSAFIGAIVVSFLKAWEFRRMYVPAASNFVRPGPFRLHMRMFRVPRLHAGCLTVSSTGSQQVVGTRVRARMSVLLFLAVVSG